MDITLFITVLHIIGVSLGVGGATVSDLLFFRAIADKKVSRDEFALLNTLSLVLWAGLALLFVSGIGFITTQFVLSGSSIHLVSAWFWAKMSIVAILFGNSLIFHHFVFPFLKTHQGKHIDYERIKPKAALFATTGVISIVSWYCALILGVTRGLSLPYAYIINIYIVLLLSGMLVAYLLITLVAFPSDTHTPSQKRLRSIGERSVQMTIIAIALGILLVLLGWYLPRMMQPRIPAPEVRSQTYLVCVSDTQNTFDPAQVLISVGDTVAWSICDDNHHTARPLILVQKLARYFFSEAYAHNGETHGESNGETFFGAHPITVRSGPESFSTQTNTDHIVGDTFYHTFTVAGTYIYMCPLHNGTEGLIIVEA